MKARSLILRALLFAIVLAPSALRISARPLSAPSCRIPKVQLRSDHVNAKAASIPDRFVGSTAGHRTPAPRLHRIRGKKISIQNGFTSAPRCYAQTIFRFSAAPFVQQDMDGPNPSRGPPSHLS
jgi:hypothetical protein